MRILCLLANGFEEGEALMPCALLRRAGLSVDICGVNEINVSGTHDIQVVCDCMLCDVNPEDYDCLMLPGGRHYQILEKDERVLKLIREFHDSGRYIACICAAPTILGHLGLLKGKKYTCFTSMNEDFGGEYTDAMVETDGKLISAKSVSAATDFGLEMVRVLGSDKLAEQVKKRIYYPES